MTAQTKSELLAQLKGNHLPDPPDAPELWPVYLSFTICLLVISAFLIRTIKTTRRRNRHALNHLNAIKKASGDDSMQQLAALLKRIVLTEKPDQALRQIHGEPWLEYLDDFFHTNFFSAGEGRAFGDAIYQSQQLPSEALYKKLHELIKRRRWTRR